MTWRSTFGRWKRRLQPRTPASAILMYHRVASVKRDPWDLAVSTETFDRQMAHLARHHTPLSLKDFVSALKQSRLPSNAVAITFDDGYRDNLVNAMPLLEKHGLPATLFLATGSVDRPESFWWDELTDMILSSTAHVNLHISIGGEVVPLVWGELSPMDRDLRWRAAQKPRTPRETTYLAVWSRLKQVSNAERSHVMARLRECLRTPPQDGLAMPMSGEEVRRFCASPWVSLGAHTLSHPALTLLDTEECRKEVHQSLLACESYAQTRIEHFAYPYGDMNSVVRKVVTEVSFTAACSTQASQIDPEDFDCFTLPRLAAIEQPMKEFKARLLRQSA